MRFHTILAAAVAPLALGGVLLISTAASAATQAPAQFRTVDVPRAAGTTINSVNSMGVMLGTWFDSKGNSYGFTEQPGGHPVTFSYLWGAKTALAASDLQLPEAAGGSTGREAGLRSMRGTR